MGRGRKSNYYKLVEPKLEMIKNWCRDGDIEETICEKLGVGVSTFGRYKLDYKELRDALKEGKETIDYEVENALLKRALGYSYVETTRERMSDDAQKKRHLKGDFTLTNEDWGFAVNSFDNKCCYCGEEVKLTKDHLVPYNSNGDFSRENIVPCCQKCNNSKSDIEMELWFRKQEFFTEERLSKILQYVSEMEDKNYNDMNGDSTSYKMVITKEVTKQISPDTTAQIFWLKNRKPKQWRDKQDIEHSGKIETEYKEMSEKELEVKLEELRGKK